MSSIFSPREMVDFIWWATHVLQANISTSAEAIRVWIPCYPVTDNPRSDVVFEIATGRVYSNYPMPKWLDADTPKEWRETLLDGVSVMSLSEKFPCGQMSCCLFRPEWEDD